MENIVTALSKITTDKSSGVYRIINTINGKCYVGSTAQGFNIRQPQHLRKLKSNKHHSPKLQRSFNKHGIESFVFEIIEYCSKENVIEKEQHWIDSLKPEYNIAPKAGNTIGLKPWLGRKHSQQTKNKMSKSYKPKPMHQNFQLINNKRKKQIAKIDIESKKIIEIFNSIYEASIKENCHPSEISLVVSGKRFSAKGYKWVEIDKSGKLDENSLNRSKIVYGIRKIKQIDFKTNEIIEIFNSMGQASKKLNINVGGISDTCNGKQKQAGGFKWQYADENNID